MISNSAHVSTVQALSSRACSASLGRFGTYSPNPCGAQRDRRELARSLSQRCRANIEASNALGLAPCEARQHQTFVSTSFGSRKSGRRKAGIATASQPAGNSAGANQAIASLSEPRPCTAAEQLCLRLSKSNSRVNGLGRSGNRSRVRGASAGVPYSNYSIRQLHPWLTIAGRGFVDCPQSNLPPGFTNSPLVSTLPDTPRRRLRAMAAVPMAKPFLGRFLPKLNRLAATFCVTPAGLFSGVSRAGG